jgi:tetratricopeptide (TPR) repeat protein
MLAMSYRFLILWIALALALPARAPAATAAAGDVAAGLWLLRQHDIRGAEAQFRGVLRRSPLDVEALQGLGLVLIADGRAPAAVTLLAAAVERHPELTDLTYVLGQAELAAGQNERACAHLERLWNLDPARVDLGFYLGVVYYRLGRYREAVARFNGASISGDAVGQQLTLYRGLALGHLGQNKEALAQLNFLGTEGNQTIAQLAVKLQGRLNVIPGEQRTRGFLKIAEQYDTNPVVAPTVNVFGLPFPKTESPGQTINGQVAHDLVQASDHKLTLSYTFLQTLNDRIHEVDLQDHTLTLAYQTGRQQKNHLRQSGVIVAYDDLLLGNAAFVQRANVAGYTAWRAADGTTETLFTRFQLKDFLNDSFIDKTPNDLDALNYLVGFTHTVPLWAGNGSADVGYQLDREMADGSNLVYTGHRGLLAARGRLWNTRANFEVSGQYHVRSYDNVDTFFGVQRGDHELIVTGTLSRQVGRQSLVSLEYLNDRNHSNLALFDFKREITSLAFSRRF